jgi:hypothetical protein
MEAIIRKISEREAEGKKSTFRVRGQVVRPDKIERYKVRRGVQENALLSQPSPAAS